MMGKTTSWSTDQSDENYGPGGAVEGSPDDASNVDQISGRDRDAGASDEVLDATHPTQIEANDEESGLADQADPDDNDGPDNEYNQDEPEADDGVGYVGTHNE